MGLDCLTRYCRSRVDKGQIIQEGRGAALDRGALPAAASVTRLLRAAPGDSAFAPSSDGDNEAVVWGEEGGVYLVNPPPFVRLLVL